MANKQSLRDFQQALASRLASARSKPAGESMLAFEAGESRWVLPVSEVAEVVPGTAIATVPGVKNWMMGIANVRGALIAVTDLGLFLGSLPASQDTMARILVLGGPYQTLRAGLLVSQVYGLRPNGDWLNEGRQKFSRRIYKMAGEADYHELNVRSLIDQGSFLNAARDENVGK